MKNDTSCYFNLDRKDKELFETFGSEVDGIYNIRGIATFYAKQYGIIGTSYLEDFYQDVYELYIKLKSRIDLLGIIGVESFRPYFFASVKTLAIKKIKLFKSNGIVGGDFNISFSEEGALDFISGDLNQEQEDFLNYEKLNFKTFSLLLDFLPIDSRSVIRARYIHKFNSGAFSSLPYESLKNFKKPIEELKKNEENGIDILKKFLAGDYSLANYTYVIRQIDDNKLIEAIENSFGDEYIKLVNRVIKYMKPRKVIRKLRGSGKSYETYNSISMSIVCRNLSREISSITGVQYNDISDLESFIFKLYSNICKKICEYLNITPKSVMEENL